MQEIVGLKKFSNSWFIYFKSSRSLFSNYEYYLKGLITPDEFRTNSIVKIFRKKEV